METRVVPGRPLAALLTATGEAGLLVVGSTGTGGVRARLLGSVGQALLARSSVPVAVVKAGRPS
ncbi:hypothetical protein MPTA5024_01350 [Microbispora sp. ATCC PTA-5024]|nr:hypothetical protein MPTA5024_01350 [Microbispora sp. ATCC PTA-5024]